MSDTLDTADAVTIAKLVSDGVLSSDEARALEAASQLESGTSRMEALSETSGEGAFDKDKDLVKEQAVKHKRHWVRVTRVCNQRCTFCLDSMNQDGSFIDVESLKAYIAMGRKLGRERLILSGGEASMHPNYIELIVFGKQVGYEWIQTVTNGMLFSYKNFARAAVQAGLDEVTVSMHGHTAYLHDKLTGTPGAFVTGVKGMQNLLALGNVVVNVDVVINKQNYKYLREILDYYMSMGINEFDLLHIIPFGRGFDEYRHSLFFDLDDAMPYFRKAFEVSRQPGVYIWTNRLPVQYLEDFERLIQDPHKLYYEFDGGRHNFEGYLKRGLKPDCWGERCDYCFLDRICRSTMFPYRERLVAHSFEHVRLDARQTFKGTRALEVFEAQRPQRVWLTGHGDDAVEAVTNALGTLGFGEAKVAVEAGPEAASLAGTPRVDRLVARDMQEAVALLDDARVRDGDVEVEIVLTREVAQWLVASPEICARYGKRLIGRLGNHEFMSESESDDPPPEMLRALSTSGILLKNVPPCVAGPASVPHDHGLLDANLLDGAGDLDLDRYVHHYIVHEYAAKSLRCKRCAFDGTCKGMHIQYLRNHGFRILQPVDARGLAVPGGDAFETAGKAETRPASAASGG